MYPAPWTRTIQTVKIMTSLKQHSLISGRYLALYAFAALLSSCGDGSTREAQSPQSENTVLDTVPVFRLKADTLKKVINLPGELLPNEQTDLYAKIPGFVRTMKVDIGDRVRKGQTLALLDAPEVNTQFAEAESAIQAAKSKWTGSRDNFERLLRASQSPSPGIVAPVDLEAGRNQMMADSASYEAARKKAEAYEQVSRYLTILAPFDGVITARKVDPGALVGINAMLLTVQNNSSLRLRVAIPEMYVASASTARNIQFIVDAYPERSFAGILTRKTETVDPTTRTELWEFDVDNSRHLLKAGVFAYARINIERKGFSFIIPSSAMVTTLERRFVIKVTNGRAQWIDVRQGMTTDGGVEVFGKLTAGDTLLIKATDEKKPGSTAYWKMR
jgi:membrane fusion protein (multidrug efflux system)